MNYIVDWSTKRDGKKLITYKRSSLFGHNKRSGVKYYQIREIVSLVVGLAFVIKVLYTSLGKWNLADKQLVQKTNTPVQTYDFTGKFVPYHYYAIMRTDINDFDQFASSYTTEYGASSNTGFTLHNETMCGALAAGVTIRGQVYNKQLAKFEEEQLFFKMKCNLENIGGNKYAAHLYYDFDDVPISGLQNSENIKYIQTDYYKETINPGGMKMIFNETWTHSQ